MVTSGALTFEVRAVTSRALLFGGELGLQDLDLRLQYRDRLGHRLVTTR